MVRFARFGRLIRTGIEEREPPSGGVGGPRGTSPSNTGGCAATQHDSARHDSLDSILMDRDRYKPVLRAAVLCGAPPAQHGG